MVYPEALQFVYIIAVTLIVFFLCTPIAYHFWFDNLRNQVNTGSNLGKMLLAAGDLYFQVFIILGFMIVGIEVFWYFAVAARKGTQEEEQGNYF
jgi:hypothetical protein